VVVGIGQRRQRQPAAFAGGRIDRGDATIADRDGNIADCRVCGIRQQPGRVDDR
jgi:hypothetical protein